MSNLNSQAMKGDSGDRTESQRDYSAYAQGARVYFRDIRNRLMGHILEADVVLGCVAWLTDAEILSALTGCKAVSLLINKEDFLRPDSRAHDGHKRWLLERYRSLRPANRYLLDDLGGRGVGGGLSICTDPTIQPVRCVGMIDKARGRNAPRMHNKFCVFCREVDDDSDRGGSYIPFAAWTGSFNWSSNASESLENAIYLTDRDLVEAFYLQYQQVLALSEPLDWFADYVEPEWRIGT